MSICVSSGSCNSPCRAIYLQMTMSPTSVSGSGATVNVQYTLVNVSGNAIVTPVVISSSILGTILVSASGMTSGQSTSVNTTFTVPATNVGQVTNVSFAAVGIIGPTSAYTVGSRLSKIVSGSVTVGGSIPPIGGPEVFVNVSGSGGASGTTLVLHLTNQGIVPANYFTMTLNNFFSGCSFNPVVTVAATSGTTPILPLPIFHMSADSNTLTLAVGSSIPAAGNYTITISVFSFGTNPCPANCGRTCTPTGPCVFPFYYSNDSNPISPIASTGKVLSTFSINC